MTSWNFGARDPSSTQGKKVEFVSEDRYYIGSYKTNKSGRREGN